LRVVLMDNHASRSTKEAQSILIRMSHRKGAFSLPAGLSMFSGC
jgi:hypothetical protein